MERNGKKNLKNGTSVRSISTDWSPSTDIYQTIDGWVIKMELAGIDPEDLQVRTANRSLIIKGFRRDSFIERNWVHLSMEILYSSFERRIELPVNADVASIKTEYRDGMLIVKIKKNDWRKS
ncbi:MAG: Hsp20/alpha crystallin family protein [Bdellovibrio sp.]|nr:Hsp20/alpha crystallin family protein [Bdellovibrio sp.]